MRLNVTMELLDDDNTGMRIRRIDVGKGKIEGYIEHFDEKGVYKRSQLTSKSLARLINILETGELQN